MDFPTALEAYAAIEQTNELTLDRLLAREVFHNEIEVKQFFKTYSNDGNKIVIKPLTPDELSDPRIS